MATIVLPKEYSVTVTEKKELYPTTVHLRVTSPSPIPFKPGQYASFIINGGRRPFSFVSLPEESEIQFIIGYGPHGLTKPFIEPLQVGESFTMMAPYGQFIVDEADTRPLLLIAGGTGIAPIHAQIKQALNKKMSQEILLYYASFDEQRQYLANEFKTFEQNHNNFSYRPTLSEPPASWTGRKGLVTTIIPKEIKNLTDYTAYVCGSPGFVIDTIASLKNNGMPASQIHFERFT